MKRVLVLGAGGFVGRRVVQALAAAGWAQPIAGVHRARPDLPSGVPAATVEATDRGSMARALSEAELVVNCVGGDARALADGTRCLFECAAKVDTIDRIVHLSSMAVYGSAAGRVRETAALKPDVGWYSQAKVQGEESARVYAQSGGRVVILRPGCIFGPGSEAWTGRIGRWLRAGRIGDLGPGGDGCANLVLVDDVVAAVVAALQEPRADGHAINLAHPAAGTWNSYFVRFGRAIGSTPIRRISRRRLKLEAALAPPLKVAATVARRLGAGRLGLPEPMPPSLLRLLQQDIQLDSTRAEALLGLAWTPTEQGIADAAEWFTAAYPGRSPADRRHGLPRAAAR